ncbi:unnamed protein product [Umbelopsis sp. WA50703]
MSYTYNPNKRTRVSSNSINYVRQLLVQQARSLSIINPPVANNSESEYDYSEYMDFNDEPETTGDFLENEEPFDSECLLADSFSSSEVDNELLEDLEQADDDIEYKLNIPKFAFTNIEKYSVMFEEVCDTYNISREGSRAMRHLINMMLADESLGKYIN